jgi:SWI/SNF-related matrix-associated actin-dependent regulator of chromatin subfamily A member 5
MITHGAEKIINSSDELLINDDIDAIIARGEERTVELNQKYEGLNLDDLTNFKSAESVQQWEGEDFRAGVIVFLNISVDKSLTIVCMAYRHESN